MALRALNPDKVHDYVLMDSRNDPDPTIFKLKVLDPEESAKIQDSLGVLHRGTDEVQFRSGSAELKIIKAGLIGWENLLDENGQEVPFHEHAPGSPNWKANMGWLRPDWRRELANAITEANFLDEEKVKNSGSPSPSCEEATSA